ncbi:MAG: DNA polymerase III subunit alpha [Actinobacteria bacterium]|nr:DNA polymerase III subunit alpha [Actinomycetota bacterium]
MGASFSHLHVHTEFSMLDGAAKLDELVAKAVADGQPALGITDHGNMFGVLDFYRECRQQGIKPIVGTEAYMAGESRFDRPPRRGRLDDTGGDVEGGGKLYYHLTLLAENDLGYRNLIKLSSLAFLEGFYYQPRMDWDLLSRHSEGLIATTGCLGGHVLQHLLRGDYDGARSRAARLQEIFGRDNLFVELQDHHLPDQARTNPLLMRLAQDLGAPLLATNDSHYVHRHDSAAHDALLCVQTGSLMSDPNRFKFDGTEHYLKTADEMRYLFREVPEACDNTLWIAERSDLTIEFGKPQLPSFPLPNGFTTDAEYLRHLTLEGATQRWGGDLPPSVVERLAYELKVIEDMGFASYFLIVWDLIRHAKERGIRVGPGRGSAAGCATAYCLRITEIDPIRYDLLFERFLNPSRISMPDIDMDFDSRYRDEVIRYVTEKYGRDRVAQIITFNTIKARNAVRDAARVLGHDYGVGDKLAKAMPPLVMGRDTPLKYCLEPHPKFEDGFRAATELREMYETDPVAKEVIDVAKGLEGLKRSTGIHAAAVVISKEPLVEYLPVQRKPEQGKSPDETPITTQYEMHGVEDLGLLKMDFLGLRNLDVITDTVALIRSTVDPSFDIDTVSLEEPAVFELLGRGETTGVFQLESSPMQQLLRAMSPTNFEDVSALIALYRPGPMSVNMHYDYADRKNRRKPVEYFHPQAEEILSDTYGLMIYQESVMRVAQRFAGYSLAEADNLRKACGKKVRELMEQERSNFIEGCDRTGYGTDLGIYLFDIIENFADYAFTKSHSFGYGLVCYQTAYLKAKYPVHFFAALLTSVKDDLDKAAGYLADARRQRVEVRPPDINVSDVDFSALPAEMAVTFGLSAIKGVGTAVCGKIVAERRAGGPFESFHDFCMRVPTDCLNKRTIESFIKVGAFDSLKHPRRGLLTVFEEIIDDAVSRRHEADQGVLSLFDGLDDGPQDFSLDRPIPELQFDRELTIKFERELLGLYITDHPLAGHEATLARHTSAATVDVSDMENGAVCTLGGVVSKLEKKTTRRGDQMLILNLEDFHGSVEVTLFSKAAAAHGHKIREDGVVLIKGRVNANEDRRSFSAIEVEALRLSVRNPELRLNLPVDTIARNRIDELREILRRHPGESPVFLHLGPDKILELGADFAVEIDRVVPDLRVAFGIDVILPSA